MAKYPIPVWISRLNCAGPSAGIRQAPHESCRLSQQTVTTLLAECCHGFIREGTAPEELQNRCLSGLGSEPTCLDFLRHKVTTAAQGAIVRQKGVRVKALDLCLALNNTQMLAILKSVCVIGPGPSNHLFEFC